MRVALLAGLWLVMSIAASAQPVVDLDALETRAAAAFAAGKTQEAIDLLQQVRAGRRAAKAPALEARALFRLTVGYRGQGKTADALQTARAGLDLAIGSNTDAMVAEILRQLHQLGAHVPGFPDAKTLLDEALRRATLANEPRTLARIYDTRGRWIAESGSPDDAIAEVNEGLAFAHAANDDALVAGLLSIRATFTSRAGRLSRS